MKNAKVLTVLWILFILTLLVLGKTFSAPESDAESLELNQSENIASNSGLK